MKKNILFSLFLLTSFSVQSDSDNKQSLCKNCNHQVTTLPAKSKAPADSGDLDVDSITKSSTDIFNKINRYRKQNPNLNSAISVAIGSLGPIGWIVALGVIAIDKYQHDKAEVKKFFNKLLKGASDIAKEDTENGNS